MLIDFDDLAWVDRSTPADDLRSVFDFTLAGRVHAPDAPSFPETSLRQAWLRWRLVSDATRLEIRFPWWDSLSDMAPFVDWLRTAADGEVFSDCDQGWTLQATRKGERFHLQDGDLDTGEEFANVSVDRRQLLDDLEIKEADIRRVIARL